MSKAVSVLSDLNQIKMFKLCILVGVIAACYADSTIYEPRIDGGSQVEIGNYPFVVSVLAPGMRGRIHVSTGTILNNRWILTVASRLKYYTDPRAFQIRTGSSHSDYVAVDYSVEERINHPSYVHDLDDFDLTLLKVDRDIVFSDMITSIELSSADNVDSTLSGNLFGWGNTYVNFITVSQLYSIDLKTVGTVDGYKLHVAPISDDVCSTDVGGPFIVDGKVIGIATLNRLGCGLDDDQYLTQFDKRTLKWINGVIDLAIYEPRIDGGSPVVIANHPFVVSVQAPGVRGRIHVSTGTILNNRWILTIASRLKLFIDPRAFQIRTGSAHSDHDVGVDYSVEERINHPSYVIDLALLKVDRDIVFSDTVTSIELSSVDTIDFTLSGNLFGWGNTYVNSLTVSRLYSIDLKTVGTVVGYKLHVTPVGDDVCSTDVGGPFIVDDKVIGITTLNRLGCGFENQYVTQIDKRSLKWINGVIDLAIYEPRIDGGLPVDIANYPFVVSVQAPGVRGRIHVSTGTILNNRWILTIASRLKFFTDPRAFQIRTGSTHSDYAGGVDYSVEERVNHPSNVVDLALLKVDRDIVFSDTATSIELSSADNINSTLSGSLFGWGNTYVNSLTLSRLYSIDLKTVGNANGYKLHVAPVSDDVCSTDVGGPYIVNGDVIGIATLNRLGCGFDNQYVTQFDARTLKWINSVIGGASEI